VTEIQRLKVKGLGFEMLMDLEKHLDLEMVKLMYLEKVKGLPMLMVKEMLMDSVMD
jgi:hypothetical protein